MLKVIDAIDYATDHNARVSDDFIRKASKVRAFFVRKGDDEIMITQLDKGSRLWRVNGQLQNRASAIVIAVNELSQ